MIPIYTPPKGLTLTCDHCGAQYVSHHERPDDRFYLDPKELAVLCAGCSGHDPPRRGRRRRRQPSDN